MNEGEEFNEDDMKQVIEMLYHMDLPKLKMLRDHVDHEIELVLKEAENHD